MVIRATEDGLTDAVLRPVRGHHAFESCVGRLATAIRLGVYANGDVLPPERELAARMEVSRATLREAIAALRTAGLVRTTRGRGGGTVIDYDPTHPETVADLGDRRERLLDSLVFRRVVEGGASHVAAGRTLDAAQRALLQEAHERVADAADRGAHRQADSQFHLAIAAVTESPLIIDAVTVAQADLHDMLTAIPVLDVNIEHSDGQHAAITEAILGGRPTKARHVMESHCDDTEALLRGLLG
ncbi:FadR/GntR family transcriptional regulator [Solicola gregarius]|uniref:GntR family transcriptional regulator n=1 Tax=Solicola gregarius TaxID=2908642 RepID=A0AA46YLU5_9ACTN|nr:GntR family transcriptional regulator [Solicola gregarius]UYM07320.1 GntR family transcriptional regulator [Solicola gregarius]